LVMVNPLFYQISGALSLECMGYPKPLTDFSGLYILSYLIVNK